MAFLGKWINQKRNFAHMQAWQHRSLSSGRALAGHCASAHAGQFSPQCPACVELKRKQDRLQEQEQEEPR